MFKQHLVQVGSEPQEEYSLYHPKVQRWIAVGKNGGIGFTSHDPVSLTGLYSDPRAGTSAFAFEFLAWLREQAGSGEVVDGRFVDFDREVAAGIGVYRFTGQRPVMLPTGLEFEHRKDGTVDVRGPVRVVDDHLATLRRDQPALTCHIVHVAGRTKTIRLSNACVAA